ncbi:unnamed protein product, partial [Prorocentrum cordatum]
MFHRKPPGRCLLESQVALFCAVLAVFQRAAGVPSASQRVDMDQRGGTALATQRTRRVSEEAAD